MSIARITPIIGSLYALLRNRLGLNVETPLGTQELSCTVAPGRRLVVLGTTPIAGWPVDHGTVADEAAMLALHTLDSTTLLTEPTFVAPGDSCLRTDDPGWRWHCISGNGTTLADWERRPLPAALAALAADLDAGVAGAQPLDSDLTAIAEQGISTFGLAWLALAGAAAAKNALSIGRADITDSTAVGRALLAIATPAAAQLPRINADGTVTLIDVPSGGSGGGTPSLHRGLEVWLSCAADNAAVDLHGDHTTEWVGTPAGDTGKIGRAFALNGSSHVRVTNYSGLQVKDRHGWTCCAWIKTSAPGWWAGASGDPDANGRSWYGYIMDAGNSQLAWSSDGFNWTSHNVSIAYGEWCFLAVIYDPLSRVCRGLGHTGVPVATTMSAQPNVNAAALAADLCFGSDGRRTGSDMLTGLLDGCAYWSRPLGADELAFLHNCGAGRSYADLAEY